jgi:hypothetical protein
MRESPFRPARIKRDSVTEALRLTGRKNHVRGVYALSAKIANCAVKRTFFAGYRHVLRDPRLKNGAYASI